MSWYILCWVLLTEFLLGSLYVVESQSTSRTPGMTSVDVTSSTNNVTAAASTSNASAFESGSSPSATHSDFLSSSTTTIATNQSTAISTNVSSTSLSNNNVEAMNATHFSTTEFASNVTSSNADFHNSSTTAANPSSSRPSSITNLALETTSRPVSSTHFPGTTNFTVSTLFSLNDTGMTSNVSSASPSATTLSSILSLVNVSTTASSVGLQSTISSARNTTSSVVPEKNSSMTHSIVETSSSSSATTQSSAGHSTTYDITTIPDSFRTDELTGTTTSASAITATTRSTSESTTANSTAGIYMTNQKDNLAWVAAPVIGGVLLIVVVVVIVLLVLRQRRKKQRNSKFLSLERRQKEHTGSGGIMNPSFRIDTDDNERSPPAPLCIEDFVNRVGELHRDSDYGFASEFSALNKMSPQHLKSAAEMPENRTKNRFTNVLPFDHSRVKLIPADDDENGGSDYINASFLPGFSSRREFIAAQGPMKSTVDDFWRMIWEYNVTTIVMVTNLFERGREKCVQYWPEQHEPIYYGDLQVELKSESSLNYYIIRVFNVTLEKNSRRVMHYQFLTWPDFGVPKEHSHLLSFLTQVRSGLHPMSNHPVLVHCSAGVGRTGTFILVDHVLQLIRRNSAIDLFGLVLDMRNHRPHMIQTEAQYIFAYECIKYAIELGYHQGRDIFTCSDNTVTGETEGESIYMNAEQGSN